MKRWRMIKRITTLTLIGVLLQTTLPSIVSADLNQQKSLSNDPVRRQTIWTTTGPKLSHGLPDGNLFSILVSPSVNGLKFDSFSAL
jgi:hypothetical protein